MLPVRCPVRIFISNKKAKNKIMDNFIIKYGNEITGRMVRETFKSLPTDNWNNDTYRVEENDQCELSFQVGFGDETKKGDFRLSADCSRQKTRIVLYSQQSQWVDEYTKKEWVLEDMTSADWRFIEDKVRRAKKRIASKNRQNWMVYDSALSLSRSTYDRATGEWRDLEI